MPRPQLEAGYVLLRVVACGVCRTDLHIVEGDLPPLRPRLTPGHQIVGEVIEGATLELPAFDYDKLLWGERQTRSVANMTRQDARDFLKIAHDLHIPPNVTIFAPDDANKALLAVKEETEQGSAVIIGFL